MIFNFLILLVILKKVHIYINIKNINHKHNLYLEKDLIMKYHIN